MTLLYIYLRNTFIHFKICHQIAIHKQFIKLVKTQNIESDLKKNSSFIAVRMLNSETQLHYSLEVSYKMKFIFIVQSKNHTYCCLPKGAINSYP